MKWTVISLVGLWLSVHWLYVMVTAAKSAYEAGRLTLYWKTMLFLPAIAGVLLDFAFQITFGWVMFLETPLRGGWLFSGRVKHHFRNSDGWRLRLAQFWARNLNVFDPFHITPPKG